MDVLDPFIGHVGPPKIKEYEGKRDDLCLLK